jgi:hypothetical protein
MLNSGRHERAGGAKSTASAGGAAAADARHCQSPASASNGKQTPGSLGARHFSFPSLAEVMLSTEGVAQTRRTGFCLSHATKRPAGRLMQSVASVLPSR